MTIHKIMKTCNKITSSLSDALWARLDMWLHVIFFEVLFFVIARCNSLFTVCYLTHVYIHTTANILERHLRMILKCQNQDKQRLPRTPRGHRHSVTVHQGRLTRVSTDIQGKVIRQKCHSTLHKFKSNRYLPWCNSKLNFRPSQDWPGPS